MKHPIFTQQEIEQIKEIKRKNNLFTVKNFIQKLTKKLYIGSIGLLLIFIVSNIWSILVSLPTSVAITIVGVAILTTIASSLSDDKSDKWYRNN